MRTPETRADRAEVAADAGLPRISFVSVLAGTLVAYGMFAIAAAIAGAVAKAMDITTNLGTTQVGRVGPAGAALLAFVLFLSYVFGGYVAGRMARRAGATNGLLVFFLGVIVAVGIGALVRMFADTSDIIQNLRSIGIPASRADVRDVGYLTAAASLAAMLLGCLIGGVAGERWHGKLMARALDPELGAGVSTGNRVDGATPMMTTRTDTTLDEDRENRDADRWVAAAADR